MEKGYQLSGKQNTETYTWGSNCSAWVLQQSGSVIIKEELMPSGTSEQLHFHRQMDQFFYVLDGVATFLIEGQEVTVQGNAGISIKKGSEHLISNKGFSDLRFLVISAPGVPDDRINID